VELCERKFPTYFINAESEIKSATELHHFDYPRKQHLINNHYLPKKEPLKIILTSGASCPDTVVDRVLFRLLSYFPGAKSVDEVMEEFS
jgi:4-hydroxy-3-methylbut-2-enyl diphosphate reductase